MNIGTPLLELSKDNVADLVDFERVYEHYLDGKLKYGRAFSSPFRKDKNPSFVINQSNGWYKDYATGETGDFFSFVKRMYNVNFYDALKHIVVDLGIADQFIIPNKTTKPSMKLKVENISRRGTFSGNFDLKVKVREFQDHDFEYWKTYGISPKFLRLGGIYAISHYFINGRQTKAENLAYVYVENKDGKETYKVYQPHSEYMKWINGNDFSVWELWKLMPKTYSRLIITSSRKDALSIIENVEIPATSFQAESINPKPHVVDDIMNRFQKVYLLYDNDYTNPDNPGQMLAHKRMEQFGFINLVIPKNYKSKDFSDLVKNHGADVAKKVLEELIFKHEESEQCS